MLKNEYVATPETKWVYLSFIPSDFKVLRIVHNAKVFLLYFQEHLQEYKEIQYPAEVKIASLMRRKHPDFAKNFLLWNFYVVN